MIKALQIITLLFINTLFIFSSHSAAQNKKVLEPYLKTLNEEGENTVKFVLNKFDNYDLIIFDDALHSAYEPFLFYQALVKDPVFKKRIKYIFLEVISINKQPCIESYLKSSPEDQSLLFPAFQDDFSGYGWAYQTYFDLLHTIYSVNQNLPDSNKIKVLAVNNPVYWNEIKTPEDIELFRSSLIGNDYSMYRVILAYMGNFNESKKGIFLTNTRHAYKGIKDKQNKFFWNCGTFFHQWNPGKTYSIRIHNVNLFIEGKKELSPLQVKTTAGTESYNIKWVRMENGKWDYAFKEYGYKSVAFDMKDTPFGKTPYIGNHMLEAAAGQTMYDAYDGLLFLGSIDSLHMTALTENIYTPEFKKELERRFEILETPLQLNEMIKRAGCSSLTEYINQNYKYEPLKISPLSKMIGPIDEWKKLSNQSSK